MTGEVIAIVGKKVVRWTKEFLGDVLDDGLDLVLSLEGESLEKLASESASGWFHTWSCPVYARCARPIMASKCIFSVQALDDHTGMEQRAAKEP